MTEILQLAKIALRNTVKRKKRAILTILGIFIGIAAVVALVSLGQGLQQTVNAQFEKVGADKIIIQAKEIGFGSQALQGELKEQDLRTVKETNGVSSVSAILFHSARVLFNKIQRTQYVMSVPKTAREVELTYQVHNIEIETGRLLTHKDRKKALIGYNLAQKKLFGRNIVNGDKIIVNDELFEVVGTAKRTGDPAMMDNSIIMSEEDSRRILNNSQGYGIIAAQTAKNEAPEIVAEKIEKNMRKQRHQKEGREDFTVQTSTELITSFNTVLDIIQAVFAGIAAISLLVGGIGIMNTMYTSVLERTREIGIMKAIGARNSDVLLLFLIESGLLGLSGGIAGLAVGIVISKTVEIFANTVYGQGTITSAFPPELILGALLFSLITGTISGMLPARKASKLKPIEALRYE